ncbi:hypothetical protein [Candidatus Vidania fulgoroideorum]
MYCLIGSNVKNSLSPIIYKFFFSKSNYKYKKISCNKKKIYIFLIFFIKISFFINVTIPYKKKLLNISNFYTKRTMNSKSTNLILLKKNSIFSYNTDGLGFLKTFKKINIKKNIKICFFGAGGAARSIINEIINITKIKKIYLFNRTKKKTEFFKNFNKINIKSIKKNKFIKKKLIINSIPSLYFKNIIKYIKIYKCFIYNINYKSSLSDFDGMEMLHEQALECYKIYKKNEIL